jgi:hypothetical protein
VIRKIGPPKDLRKRKREEVYLLLKANLRRADSKLRTELTEDRRTGSFIT